MTNEKDIEVFESWVKSTQKQIDDWTKFLESNAKANGKTYSGAMMWLRRNRPQMPIKFSATPGESFNTVIRSMFDEATIKVRNEGLDKEIKK